jgi:hypothetical protein
MAYGIRSPGPVIGWTTTYGIRSLGPVIGQTRHMALEVQVPSSYDRTWTSNAICRVCPMTGPELLTPYVVSVPMTGPGLIMSVLS